MNCRVCGSKMVLFETAKEIPMAKSFELSRQFFEYAKRDMPLYKCPDCTHVQIENILSNDYYDSYNEYCGAAQYADSLNLTRKKLEKLNAYGCTSRAFIDIGCGTGTALAYASDYFEHCIGVEPAYNTYSIAKRRGFDVINSYFSKKMNLEEPISAFSAFQVFEHLSDIYMGN